MHFPVLVYIGPLSGPDGRRDYAVPLFDIVAYASNSSEAGRYIEEAIREHCEKKDNPFPAEATPQLVFIPEGVKVAWAKPGNAFAVFRQETRDVKKLPAEDRAEVPELRSRGASRDSKRRHSGHRRVPGGPPASDSGSGS